MEVLSGAGSSVEESIIGESAAMQEVFATIEKLRDTDANILVLGENGTGKDVIAVCYTVVRHVTDGHSLQLILAVSRNNCLRVNYLAMKKVHLLMPENRKRTDGGGNGGGTLFFG